VHLGWEQAAAGRSRAVAAPIATGVAAFGIFYGAARIARRIPVLNEAIRSVLRYAQKGSDPLVILTALANGVGEEVFFRGALFAAVGGRHPVLASTAIYTLAATATRNPALMLASATMGALFGLQRRATGGIQAPVLTHLTWSTLMLRFLPPMLDDPPPHGTCAHAREMRCGSNQASRQRRRGWDPQRANWRAGGRSYI
jgi:membrane protease YdiL (CAAX protease family)